MPDPFYEQDGVTIYHGDCLNILPGIEARPGMLLFTDPPYGINYRPGQGGNLIHSAGRRKREKVEGDAAPFDPGHLLRFPAIALFGAQHYAQRLPAIGTFHVWDKRGDYEEVHTSDFDTVWVNRREPGRIVRCVWRGLCRETEHTARFLHPTQKPLRVCDWVLDRFPGIDTVVDPYLGSGSILRAAMNRGLRVIGIELTDHYCRVAADRLAQAVLPFGGPE